MRYNPTDDSRQYLRLTLELIGLHDLPTNPLNCAIWYAYESGKSKPLDVAIDKHMENNGVISSETSRRLFEQHIANGEEMGLLLVREEMKRIFAEIIGTIKNANFTAFQKAGRNEVTGC